jgi:hypothetical protein
MTAPSAAGTSRGLREGGVLRGTLRVRTSGGEMKCLKPGMITEAGQRLRGPDPEARMAEIGAWYDKHGSSGKLADARHQLDQPGKAKTARASAVTSSRAVVVTGGGPIVRWVEGQRTAS